MGYYEAVLYQRPVQYYVKQAVVKWKQQDAKFCESYDGGQWKIRRPRGSTDS